MLPTHWYDIKIERKYTASFNFIFRPRKGPEVAMEPPEVRSVGIKFDEGPATADDSFRPRKSTTYCKEMESCDQNQ